MSTSDPRPESQPDPRSRSGAHADPHPEPRTGSDGPADRQREPAAGTSEPSHPVRPSDVRTSGGADPDFPRPQGPRTTGPGGHVLGVLVGFVLTPLALAVVALGMSRILTANDVGGDTVVVEGLGIALVALGAVVAALVALLAVRSSAIPFTGGLVALVLGAAFLFAPEATHRETVRLLATEQNTDAVLSMLTVALVGVPFVVGLVLLATGTAASLVRRRGIAVGSFRERTRAGAG